MKSALLVAAAIADAAGIGDGAGIADPNARGALDSARRADPRAVVGILRANKIPLLDLAAGVCPVDIESSEPWREALRIEAASREEQRAAFAIVTARLRSEGIDHVLFKSAGGFPYRSSNLDLLVAPARFRSAAGLLEAAGHLRMPHYREDHKLLFHRFQTGRSVLSVHLHDAVSWGRVVILEGSGAVARAVPSSDGSFSIASPADRLVTTLAHALYETDQVRLSDLRTLRLAVADPAFSWEAARARVAERGWEDGFFAIITIVAAVEARILGSSCIPDALRATAFARMEESAWAGRYARRLAATIGRTAPPSLPLRLSKVNSKVHYVERLMRQSDRAPDERLADVVAAGWNLLEGRLKLRCRPAVVVSLSGLDGSGKSMVVRAVRAAMEVCEIPVRTVWSRGGFTGWMAAVKRHGRRVLPIPGPGAAEEKRRWLERPVVGSVFAFAVLVEQLAHHALRVAAPRALGWSIVCDRHVYDTAADLLVKATPAGADLIVKAGPRWGVVTATRLLIGLTRRPDLPLLLDLSPATAVRRKTQDAGAEPERQAAALTAIARAHGLVRIDADRSDVEVIDEAVERTLRAAFAKFEPTDAPLETRP